MYQVSQDYIDKILSVGRKRRFIRGNINGVSFTEHDILEGSFSYTDIAVNSADVKLGGVFVGTLNLTFLSSFAQKVTRGTWRGKKIEISIGLSIDEGSVFEYVPLKPYYVDEANHSALGVDIVAYDVMAKLDKALNMSTTSGSLYDLSVVACAECGIELGLTEAQMNALPNGGYIFGLYSENDCETWRDLVSWIAVTIGGFATINREGKLVYRTWHTEPDIEIDKHNRFKGGSWSDFSTNYTAITVSNIANGTTWYEATEEDNGLTLDIGSNPLLQYGLDDVKHEQRMNILNAVQNLKYVPFASQSLLDPALDLGDVISYPEGIANDSICCVMKIEFSFTKGAKVQGYGKNPSLANARSKADKALTQAMGKQTENEVVTHTFVNSQAYTIRDSRTRILRIKFSTLSPRTITLLHEINLDLSITDPSGVATCTAYYYLDGELESYKPIASWNNDGMHILSLMYFLKDLIGGAGYEWAVWLKIDGGTAYIDREKVHAILQGQGLVALDKFDGLIELTDEVEPYVLGLDVGSLADRIVALSAQAPRRVSASDRMQACVLGVPMASITDSRVSLTAVPVQFTRITEDSTDEEEIVRVLEDGGIRLTEG